MGAVTQRLGFGPERVAVNIERYGNTSVASVPLALVEAVDAGRLHEGSVVLLTAVGAGMAWASALSAGGVPSIRRHDRRLT
jgi:3-oxoacyl-[acyl-carrier-protein] synthase-3